MITFLSAALKGGKNSTWWLVSILSGDTPLFFCNGLFLFCFLPFITEVLFLQMLKTCPFNICERFVAKVLCCTCSHCGRFSTCILPFCESFVSANVKNVSVRYLQAVCCESFLLHLSTLWAVFNLQFAFFRKFCFLKMFNRVCSIFL